MICKTTLAKKTLQLQNNLQKEILWSNTLGKCDILFPSTRRTSSHLDMLKTMVQKHIVSGVPQNF